MLLLKYSQPDRGQYGDLPLMVQHQLALPVGHQDPQPFFSDLSSWAHRQEGSTPCQKISVARLVYERERRRDEETSRQDDALCLKEDRISVISANDWPWLGRQTDITPL